jgi:hypothetical protein
MATYDKGILGPFSGTVGTVVGASWRGKSVMRSRPKKTSHTPTESQKLQREKFSVAVQFITPIKSVLSRYFGINMGSRSRLNLATSYTMKEVLQWTGSEYEILYNKFMISKGELQGIQDGSVRADPSRVVTLEWVDNSGQGMALPDDQLLVVFYVPAGGVFEVYEHVAERAERSAQITLPAYLADAEVEIWATFVNDTHKRAATSSYLGQLTVI